VKGAVLGFWTKRRKTTKEEDVIVKSQTVFQSETIRLANPTPITKVVTDIDDTVVSSGGLKLFGIKLGGIDNRYRRGQVYPGVIQFALELCRSGNESSLTQKDDSHILDQSVSNKDSPDKVAVLTARANEFKFALALKASGKLCKAYNAVGQSNGLHDWGIGDVYYGSVAEWILQHRKGLRKFKNFEIMLKQDDDKHNSILSQQKLSFDSSITTEEDPLVQNSVSGLATNRQYILIGDTGEKDEEAGELMAKNYPTRVKAIFLHAVHTLKPKRGQMMSDIHVRVPDDRQVNGVPVCYFRTYVGAAVKAYQHQMISRDGVIRVAETAKKDLEQIDKSLKKHSLFNRLRRRRIEELQNLRWKELKTDLEAVESISGKTSQ
jgi:hypothetical protein